MKIKAEKRRISYITVCGFFYAVIVSPDSYKILFTY